MRWNLGPGYFSKTDDMNKSKFSLCVYCGSRPGNHPDFSKIAHQVGKWIGTHGGQLVYGGGRNGLMGTVADATLAAGGRVIGVIPKSLVDKEHLPNAITLNSIQFNLARVIGPTLGGLALSKLGAQWCFGLNALSFVAVIISLLIVRPMFVPKPSTEGVFASMKKGIDFIRAREAMACAS